MAFLLLIESGAHLSILQNGSTRTHTPINVILSWGCWPTCLKVKSVCARDTRRELTAILAAVSSLSPVNIHTCTTDTVSHTAHLPVLFFQCLFLKLSLFIFTVPCIVPSHKHHHSLTHSLTLTPSLTHSLTLIPAFLSSSSVGLTSVCSWSSTPVRQRSWRLSSRLEITPATCQT